jgi:hypothetical protein
MSSEGIMSIKKANHYPGLCPVKGQKSGLLSDWGPKLVLEPVFEYYQDLTTLSNAGYPTSVSSFFLYSA